VVDCDCVVRGAADAPPDGAADVVELVAGAGSDVDVDVPVVGLEVVVAEVVDGVVPVVPAEAAVCVVPLELVVDDWLPHPAATTISVSAARARVSFEVMACLLPGHADTRRRCP
jgi:hypothetical protein